MILIKSSSGESDLELFFSYFMQTYWPNHVAEILLKLATQFRISNTHASAPRIVLTQQEIIFQLKLNNPFVAKGEFITKFLRGEENVVKNMAALRFKIAPIFSLLQRFIHNSNKQSKSQ